MIKELSAQGRPIDAINERELPGPNVALQRKYQAFFRSSFVGVGLQPLAERPQHAGRVAKRLADEMVRQLVFTGNIAAYRLHNRKRKRDGGNAADRAAAPPKSRRRGSATRLRLVSTPSERAEERSRPATRLQCSLKATR